MAAPPSSATTAYALTPNAQGPDAAVAALAAAGHPGFYYVRCPPDPYVFFGPPGLDAAALQAACDAAPALPAPEVQMFASLVPAPALGVSLGKSGAPWGDTYTASVITGSDRALKADIEALGADLGLPFVEALRPREYRMAGGSRRHFGFVAQEVREALGDDGYALWCRQRGSTVPGLAEFESLRYEQLIAPLTLAVQQLADRVADLGSAQKRLGADVAYCLDTITAIQKTIRERPPVLPERAPKRPPPEPTDNVAGWVSAQPAAART